MANEAGEPEVLTELRGHTLLITLNRPEALNCVNQAVHIGIGEALERADNDPDIWVVIFTGADDQSFCAGADLKALSRGENLQPDDPVQQAWGFAGYVKHHIKKPVIAAVNGFAFGGGTEITLASDLAIASDQAQFGLTEVSRGIVAGAGGTFRLPKQIPPKIALEMIFTAERISAHRAQELGLVNHVVPHASLLDEAFALAARIEENAPIAVQISKQTAKGIDGGKIAADEPFWTLNDRLLPILMASEDAKEGPLAFAEKRKPVWKAR